MPSVIGLISRGTTLDPLTLPLPPKLGVGPPIKVCFAIGSLTERDSISVPANKCYLIREYFRGVPHPTPSSTRYPKLGDGSPHAKFVLRLARKRRDSISVPAKKLYLIRRTFAGYHIRPPNSTLSPNLGGLSPEQKLYCNWLVNGER